MLINDEPDVEFTLALGADTFIDLVNGKWRRSEDVLQLVGYRIVVFRRLSEEGSASSSSEEKLLRRNNRFDEGAFCLPAEREGGFIN